MEDELEAGVEGLEVTGLGVGAGVLELIELRATTLLAVLIVEVATTGAMAIVDVVGAVPADATVLVLDCTGLLVALTLLVVFWLGVAIVETVSTTFIRIHDLGP